MADMLSKSRKAKTVSNVLSATKLSTRNNALAEIAHMLNANKQAIFNANKKDIARSEIEGIAMPMIKRLKFDESKLQAVIDSINTLIQLPDPLNHVQINRALSEGLDLTRISCPIGVLGIIFESRPDALVQISTLCLKSGNCALLKGGSEASLTNRVLFDIINQASVYAGLPQGWLALMENRDDVKAMLSLDKYIDLIIPRGSNEFVKYIMNNSNIPVLGHADGICHVYVDSYDDIDTAVAVCVDSKAQYVAVCNAAETLLVNEKAAKVFLPALKKEMDRANVKLLGCKKTCSIIDIEYANDGDWDTEYLDYIMSVKIVSSTDEAIVHINQHGSGHTDTVLTTDEETANIFINLVDSSSVMVNASTRFSDGYRYGLGAEVGVSTGKIHARGPMGMEGLLIYKYIVKGQNHIVADFQSGKKKYTHIDSPKIY
ncbi:MAG: glutamate-5-semialdehyde dehydrogenase [Clostridiales bacterium]|nr:glutamate-5-semialdehyde dehydrogenase [Clostridiales bacterium]